MSRISISNNFCGITGARPIAFLKRVNMTEGDCNIFGNANHITTAVIGDSQANALRRGWRRFTPIRKTGSSTWDAPPVPPVRGLVEDNIWHLTGCQNDIEQEYKFVLETPSVTTVIMGIFSKELQLMDYRVSPPTPDRGAVRSFWPSFDQDIADLTQHGKKVIVSFDSPYLPIDPRDCLRRPFEDHRMNCNLRERDLIMREPYVSLYRDLLKDRTDVCTMNVSDLLIENGKVKLFDDEGKLLMRDNHHVGRYGSEQAAILFKKSLCYGKNP